MGRRHEAWRKRQIKLVERAQDRCVNAAVSKTESVMYEAVEFIWKHFETSGTFFRPSLNELFNISRDFYADVIESAFECADAATGIKRPLGPRRLANRWGPKGIPRTLRDLVQVFGDRRYFPQIMKRSKVQTEKLRRDYLRKLEQRFKKLLPRVVGGQISPAEAKAELRDAWQTSKARVSTIFRTETSNYFAKVQVAYFNKSEDVIGFLFDSVRDKARTDICRSRHGMVLRPGSKELKENSPALHWNCRSHLIPLVDIPENQKLMNEYSRQPENRRLADLPPNWRK